EQYDSEKPAGCSAGNSDIVGIDDHRQPAELIARECDRIGCGNKNTLGDVDRTRVLAHARAEQDLRRCRRQGGQEFGEEADGKLPTRERARSSLSGTQIHRSCCSGVFVDESAESVASLKLVWRIGTDET